MDPLSAILNIGNKVLDKFFPDPAQRDAAKLELLRMQQTGELAQLTADTDLAKGQLAINQIEAGNANLFVAGWRPFIGWVCGTAFAYTLIIHPFMIFMCAVSGKVLPPLPNIDTNLLGWALGGILGLGTMRTTEKIKGVTK
jgi:hypothetical protein